MSSKAPHQSWPLAEKWSSNAHATEGLVSGVRRVVRGRRESLENPPGGTRVSVEQYCFAEPERAYTIGPVDCWGICSLGQAKLILSVAAFRTNSATINHKSPTGSGTFLSAVFRAIPCC
jgi:hypothetical protein